MEKLGPSDNTVYKGALYYSEGLPGNKSRKELDSLRVDAILFMIIRLWSLFAGRNNSKNAE